MLYGLGTDVPTPGGPQTMAPGAAYCGSVMGVQQMLADMGFPVTVDGAWGPETQAALMAAGQQYGISFPAGLDAGACEALIAAWQQRAGQAATAVSSLFAQYGRPGLIRPMGPWAPAPAPGPPPGDTAMTSPDATSSWWSQQSTPVQAGIILGGVAVVGGVAYFAFMR
jgi:hypothetical protein